MKWPTVGANPTRRRVLRSGAGLGALSLGVGRAAGDDVSANRSQIAAADDRHQRDASVTERFEAIVDLRKAGADPTGSDPIDDVLGRYTRDDTLVILPAGTYKVEQMGFYATSNWGVVGVGDVTVVPTASREGVFAGGYRSEDIWFEGFTLDIRGTGSPTMDFSADGDVVVRDISVVGRYDDRDGKAFGFRPLSDGANHLIENVSIPGGGNCMGIYAAHDRGTLTVRDCHVEGFWNNGVYASSATSEVFIDGGTYKNNNVANVRVGSAKTTVRDARVVVDSKPGHWINQSADMRGVRIADGPASGAVTIEGCDIEMSGGHGSGAITSTPTAGEYVVRNTRIRVDDGYTVDAGDDRSSFAVTAYGDGETDRRQVFENVSVTGNASAWTAMRFKRGNTTLRNVCIQQPNRNGVDFQAGGGNEVRDSTINVGGYYTVDGPASVSNLSTDGSCPVPRAPTDASVSGASTGKSIPGTVQAENYDSYRDAHEGVDTERGGTRDGTPNVGWTRNGEWLKYEVDATPGTYDVVADVAGTGSPGEIHLTLNGGYIATIDVPDTGGWHDWKRVAVRDVDVPTDDRDATLRVTFDGGDTNLNRIEFR